MYLKRFTKRDITLIEGANMWLVTVKKENLTSIPFKFNNFVEAFRFAKKECRGGMSSHMWFKK